MAARRPQIVTFVCVMMIIVLTLIFDHGTHTRALAGF
jgi:hypothetical protein